MMNPKYIELPKRNYALTMNAIGNNQIFIAPIDILMLINYGGRPYNSGQLIKDMQAQINVYPLNHEEWVQA